MHSNATPASLRDGLFMADLTDRSEIPVMKWLLKPRNARGTLSEPERGIVDAVKLEGSMCGRNPLNDYMFWFMYHGISDIYTAQVPDMLHTLYKGLVVKNIEKSAQLIYYLSNEDSQCLVQIDRRIIMFPTQQSVNPFSKKAEFYQG